MSEEQFIDNCQKKVLNGVKISKLEATELINTADSNLDKLAHAANYITREFQGNKVDVEELNNIKKNSCSEDCAFCAQSAFFDTGINTYQLPSHEEIVQQAKKAYNDGAESYCLVAAWREPSPFDFKKVCDIINEINNKVGIKVDCSLGFLTK
ncbi:MAG: biotin synthase BioB, partial [Nitrosopumilaceae archaeon]